MYLIQICPFYTGTQFEKGQQICKLAVVGCGHVGVERNWRMGCGFVCL